MSPLRSRRKLHIPYKEYLIPTHIRDDTTFQGKREEANYLAIERWANLQLGTGKPYHTIVVAASDSTAEDKDSADYVGGDATTIQAAIDALDSTLGGEIIFLEGTYSGSGMTITGDYVKISGQGAATKFTGTGTIFRVQSGAVESSFYNFTIDGNGTATGIHVSANTTDIQSLWIQNCAVGILCSSGGFHRISNCYVESNAMGVKLTDVANAQITGCGFHNNQDGSGAAGTTGDIAIMGVNPGTSNNIIANNRFNQGIRSIYLSGGIFNFHPMIIANIFSSNTTAIEENTADEPLITANIFESNTNTFLISGTTVNYGSGNYVDGTWQGYGTSSTSILTSRVIPTFFVAATDASAAERAGADYLCDGTADQTEINTAIAALNATRGGRIVLSTGTFTLSSSIAIDRPVILQGAGQGFAGTGTATRLAGTFDADAISFTTSDTSTICDLSIMPTYSTTARACVAAAAGARVLITNCTIVPGGSQSGWPIDLNGTNYARVENCYLNSSGAANSCIRIRGNAYATQITNCDWFTTAGSGIEIGSSDATIISDCFVDGGCTPCVEIISASASDVIIRDNHFYFPNGHGVSITAAAERISILNNVMLEPIGYGISNTGSSSLTAFGNIITNPSIGHILDHTTHKLTRRQESAIRDLSWSAYR